MNTTATVRYDDLEKLKRFHQQHFPGQPIPELHPTRDDNEYVQPEQSSTDLGFYEDGIRRTLTDDQISMFRHSEIQRLLAERRRQKELEEEQRQKQERMNRSFKQRPYSQDPSSQLGNDVTTHVRVEAAEINYDDSAGQDAEKPKMFQWPTLGS